MKVRAGRVIAVSVTAIVVAGAAAGVWGVSAAAQQARVQAAEHHHALAVELAQHVSRVGDQTAGETDAQAEQAAAHEAAVKAAQAAAAQAAAKAAAAKTTTQSTTTRQVASKLPTGTTTRTYAAATNTTAPVPPAQCPTGSFVHEGGPSGAIDCLPDACLTIPIGPSGPAQCITPFKP